MFQFGDIFATCNKDYFEHIKYLNYSLFKVFIRIFFVFVKNRMDI